MTPRRVRIYTVGYEGDTLPGFIARLGHAGVRALVDVREAPISRKPGFSRTALSAAVKLAGMAYAHVRVLGCPKAIRDRYRADGDWAAYTRDYLAHLSGQDEALSALVEQSSQAPVALLCYEADFHRCHRTYVAREVARRAGGRVVHLAREGAPVAELAGERK